MSENHTGHTTLESTVDKSIEDADETAADQKDSQVSAETELPSRTLRSRPGAFARPGVLIPLAVVVALLAVVGYLGFQVREQSASSSARGAALEAARGYAKDLSTYNYTNLAGNFASVTANARGGFAQQYKQVSTSLTELIKQNQAVSEGSVLSAGLVDADENRAVVALFVDQKITNTNSPQPRIDRNRMQMTLVHENGRWLIDDIKLL